MKSIIRSVMSHPDLLAKPPVLIDIGASGNLPSKWKLLAPYSICVAFDADTRDFTANESENKGWKKLYAINRLVAEKSSDELDFYLTKSPYCSSSLRPDNEALKPWAFRELFDLEKVVKLPAVDLQSVLAKIGINYIDWYKTDSQGTDLRIFDALPNKVLEKIIAAEFEPGIIDAYIGEDKLHQLMAYMDKLPFWVSHMEILGSQRIEQEDFSTLNYMQRRFIGSFLKTAPGWCGISYVNTLRSDEMTCREYLLGWVFSSIKGEHGFALHIAKMGSVKFNHSIFNELYNFSRQSLSFGYFSLAANFAVKAAKKLARSLAGGN
jgi:hypothetical protein